MVTSSYPRFEGDGTAPFVRSIAEGLVQLGHAVEVVAPYDEAVVPYHGDGVPVHRFRYAPLSRWHIMGHARALANDMRFKGGVFLLLPFFFLAQLLTTLQVARRQKADLIYAHWVVPGGFVGAWAARLLGLPLIVSLHGSDVFVTQHNAILGRGARWVFRQAEVITACSPALRDGALHLGAPANRVHLVPWGADPVKFSPEVLPLERSTFGLAASDRVIVALGRLVPKKGFDVVIRTLPKVLAEEPSVHLVIGGDGDQAASLHHLAEELGVASHVHLIGSIPWSQVASFLRMGDLFVLPSVVDPSGNLDGLPTVLLEAMAMGRAVVASSVAGVPLVIEDGVNGLLCPSGDVEAWTEIISSILENNTLRQRLGQEARKSVVKEFNWLEVACNIVAALNQAKRL